MRRGPINVKRSVKEGRKEGREGRGGGVVGGKRESGRKGRF